VSVVHRAGQRFHQASRFSGGLRRASESPVQAAARDKLQRQERQAPLFANLVDLHEVGMRELGDCLGLAAKAGQLLGAGVCAREDHL
jgi:hypothetical protein